MGLNKLEQDFREKLGSREIQPTEMAWDKLNAMLDQNEQKIAKKNNKNWLYIAAAIFVFVGLGSVFFNNSETIPVEKTVTEAPKKIEKSVTPDIVPVVKNKSQIAAAPTFAKAIIIESKIPEIAPEVNFEETPAITPSNRYIEADQLLAEAETRLQAERINKYVTKSNIKVDAKNLLQNADDEVNEDFKNRLVNSINKNYETVKTSLANRNYE
ncbi:hypothetical protein GV828_05910 [Flavobacterium sp. NST-5]|uniref:Anti-sigma factor n=1 Tax=Flavobacterium ichthyis TaxID=2698827 RepID=A0ABW9Z7S3_9FLAO|nr:hypothetical protein [Flavobacterium ichthyis]NBL64734.1 hypothetical protein [Flavobacterium ichthyis]